MSQLKAAVSNAIPSALCVFINNSQIIKIRETGTWKRLFNVPLTDTNVYAPQVYASACTIASVTTSLELRGVSG